MTDFENENIPNLFDLEEEELIAKLNEMTFEDFIEWFDYHEFGRDKWLPHHLVEFIIQVDEDKAFYVFNCMTNPICKHSAKFVGIVRGGGFVFTIAENPSDYTYHISAIPKVRNYEEPVNYDDNLGSEKK